MPRKTRYIMLRRSISPVPCLRRKPGTDIIAQPGRDAPYGISHTTEPPSSLSLMNIGIAPRPSGPIIDASQTFGA